MLIFKRLIAKIKGNSTLLLASKRKTILSEEALIWNRFIDEVCTRDINTLSEIQKNAVLCYWYSAEMNLGGHCEYFNWHHDTAPQELIGAINAVSYKAISDNYQKALCNGENDSWMEADKTYYGFSPSLSDCLQEYVERHKDVIFDQL